MFGTAIITASSVLTDADPRFPHPPMYRDGGPGLMWLGPVLILIALAVAVALGVWAFVRGRKTPTVATGAALPDPLANARAVLADRLATGDIDVDDYRTRIAELDGPASA